MLLLCAVCCSLEVSDDLIANNGFMNDDHNLQSSSFAPFLNCELWSVICFTASLLLRSLRELSKLGKFRTQKGLNFLGD